MPSGGWQDPSADLENVNAAYRIERDRVQLLEETLRPLLALLDHGYIENVDRDEADECILNAQKALEGTERTHRLVPREALEMARCFASLAEGNARNEARPNAAKRAGAWCDVFAAAERGEHVEWPATDTQEGR